MSTSRIHACLATRDSMMTCAHRFMDLSINTMCTTSGPHLLQDTFTIFSPQGKAIPKKFIQPEKFYQELDSEFNGFSDHILVSWHSFSEPWPTWEMHPAGDELVCLISGGTDVILSLPAGRRTIRINRTGEYIIVPQGVWHTAHPHEPTVMLFITPGQGTENRPEPEFHST